jgi:histidyl-tRNA synthetase
MVFEIDHDGLGSESQLCGGGRYDDLLRALGARQGEPALGFSFGVERVRLALEAEGRAPKAHERPAVYAVAASSRQAGYAARAAQVIRKLGLSVHQDVAGRSLRASLAYAAREGFTHALVVGEAEQRDASVQLRHMQTGTDTIVALDDLPTLRRVLGIPEPADAPVGDGAGAMTLPVGRAAGSY